MPIPAAGVCVGENLAINDAGQLELAPWSVPRLLVDEIAGSGADTTKLPATTTLPGRLLIEKYVQWTNDAPVDHTIRVEVTRRWKRWVTSNPNAIQFRDRWTSVIIPVGAAFTLPQPPVVSGLYNSITGSAGDLGTNTVAEPNPGVFYSWWDTNTGEEWLGPVKPGETFGLWYRMYVWTPPPFSDNANKNAPNHQAEGGWARISLMGFPAQGPLVTDAPL
jgi:hypothetical protein